MVRYCTDLIIFGTCEEKMFFTRALLDRAKGHSKTYDNRTTVTCFMEFISLREGKTHDILSEINLTKANRFSELVDWGSPIHTNLVIVFP
jgi:hypothetical protein